MQIDIGGWCLGGGIGPWLALAAILEYDRESAEFRLSFRFLCFGIFINYELPARIADRLYGEQGYAR